MKWIVSRSAFTGTVVTIGAGIALIFFTPGVRATVIDVYLLVLGGILLLALVRTAHALRRGAPRSAFDAAIARMRAPPREDADALALERELTLSRIDGFHFYVRMRPVLREIAAHRLRMRYGVELDREPARARELVPVELWDVVRPDCPPPTERLGPGPSLAEQRALLDGLEKL